MRGFDRPQATMLTLVNPEQRVPRNHPIRRIKPLAEAALKEFLTLFEQMYSEVGRSSIPPARLLKASLLMALYTMRSDWLVCDQLTELPKRSLGRTGLEVTTLGHGAMELRDAPGGPQISETTTDKILNAVLDAGLNFIDTSIGYGRREELVGRFILHRRSEDFLTSKCGCVPGAPMGAEHIHTAANIRAEVENSRRIHRGPSRDSDAALPRLQAPARTMPRRCASLTRLLR